MATLTMETRAGTKKFAYEFWNGQRLRSTRQCPLGFDTETEWNEDPLQVPKLALAVASDGRSHVVIHPDRLGGFLLLHRDGYFVGHNVKFDFWVIEQFLNSRGDRSAQRVLWEACDKGRLLDTMILDLLLQLGTGKFRKVRNAKGSKGKDDGTKVYPGNLAEVAKDYTTLRISKDDPYRMRFGELIGLTVEDWKGVDPEFFEYAVRDALTTHRLYPALTDAAYKLMQAYGFKSKAEHYEIRPDAMEKFGYLGEVIQVQASIVLAHLFCRGVHVDLGKAKALETRYRQELMEIITTLETDYREVLTYDQKTGILRLTPKGQTPTLGTRKLEAKLRQVAEEIKIQVPLTKGKKKGMSRSAKEWARYASRHPFIKCWTRLKALEKLLGFFANLNAPRLHAEYSLLMRTGRTSCSKPRSANVPGLNIQQMPKDPEFRALFIPDPGFTLFIGDYAAIELCTLAAVCKARYGHSKLGEVISQGTDPHAFTAASVQGMSLEDFMKLKEIDPKGYDTARQAAKAINFGIPGGLGAKMLVEYARNNYGVNLTEQEAEKFRRKLIDEVYPELNDKDGYLADHSMAALARNLGVTEREVWEVFDPSGERNPIAARGAAKVIKGASTASEYYQARVWDGLSRLTRTVRNMDPDVAEMIAREQGCSSLHDRLYSQSVATLTGRIRAGVGYTDGKNTPFQSLAADGAKLALWRLLHARFDVYGFVHDEILVQLPEEGAKERAKEVEQIMVRSMEEVMGHGIPAACKSGVADCWRKP